MKYIKELALILAISFIGEVLCRIVPFSIPAGIYGIVILFLMLVLKIVPLSAVEKTGDFLIEIMPLMFIPAAVGLIDSWSNIKDSALLYVVAVIVSTVIVMAVSGIVTQLILKLGGKKQ